MQRIVFFVLLMIGCFSGCATEQIGRQENWHVYLSTSGKYKLLYPSNWEAREAVQRVGTEACYEPDILLEDEIQKVTFFEKDFDLWQGEFQVKVLENARGLNLRQWAEEYKVEDVGGGDSIQARSRIEISGRPAVRLSIFGFDHEIIEIITEYSGRFYHISFAGANPNDPKGEAHRRVYEHMLFSFAFVSAQ